MAENENPAKAPSQHGKFGRIIAAVAVLCLVIYSIFNIISQQAQIAELKKQSRELSDQITEQEQRNDEYNRLLSSGDEAEYMERIAVEQLGYAYPGERRFYIVEKAGSSEVDTSEAEAIAGSEAQPEAESAAESDTESESENAEAADAAEAANADAEDAGQ